MGLDPGIVLLEDDRLIIDLFKVMIPDRKVHNFNSLTDFLELERGSRPKNCGLFFVDLCNERSPEGHETVEALSELKRLYPEAEIIVESGVSDSALMRKCIRNGASRFILKDFLSDEIPLAIDRLEEEKRLRSRIDSEILGRSDVMQNFKRELIRVLSARCGDVLVDGETGTGKELCARALRGHEDRPFVAINVAAIPAELFESEMFGAVKGAFSGAHQSKVGLLESAGNGVLFLDEIQSLDLKHQGKLLRVLETRKFRRVGSTEELPFAARVVSATNQNLPELVSKGLFREDLYYRLSALKLNLPP